MIFGSAAAPPRGEWTRTPLVFSAISDVTTIFSIALDSLMSMYIQEHPYGLRSARNATRGLQSVIQAYIIKYFVFDQRPKDKKSVTIDQ